MSKIKLLLASLAVLIAQNSAIASNPPQQAKREGFVAGRVKILEDNNRKDKAILEMTPQNTAILVIDVQFDFLQKLLNIKPSVPYNGKKEGKPYESTLAIGDADENYVKDLENKLKNAQLNKFAIIASQDWHPAGHVSFEDSNCKRFESKKLAHGETQVCWPAHCVQGSAGAQLALDLGLFRDRSIKNKFNIVKKGYDRDVDSYSAFKSAVDSKNQRRPTELGDLLNKKGIKHVIVAGLATDYCVYNTALDATDYRNDKGEPVTVFIAPSLSRAVNPGDVPGIIAKLNKKGVITLEQNDPIFKKIFGEPRAAMQRAQGPAVLATHNVGGQQPNMPGRPKGNMPTPGAAQKGAQGQGGSYRAKPPLPRAATVPPAA